MANRLNFYWTLKNRKSVQICARGGIFRIIILTRLVRACFCYRSIFWNMVGILTKVSDYFCSISGLKIGESWIVKKERRRVERERDSLHNFVRANFDGFGKTCPLNMSPRFFPLCPVLTIYSFVYYPSFKVDLKLWKWGFTYTLGQEWRPVFAAGYLHSGLRIWPRGFSFNLLWGHRRNEGSLAALFWLNNHWTNLFLFCR